VRVEPQEIKPSFSSAPDVSWSNSRLVRAAVEGSEQAWEALVDKHKNLIYSIPVRWGFSQEDATDVFQSVMADLLTELSRLRDPEALPGWLIQVSSRKCIQLKREQLRTDNRPGEPAQTLPDGADTPEHLLYETRREQMLRSAVQTIAPRCRELIRMLFFESPARPYPEVASRLGIATGSVGFIRRRCLDRLRELLEKGGFQ